MVNMSLEQTVRTGNKLPKSIIQKLELNQEQRERERNSVFVKIKLNRSKRPVIDDD